MKIVSFNTYLAPTMSDRYRRRDLLLNKILQWNNDGVDIICLQEQNSHKIGCLSRIMYKFWNNRFIDYFSLIEGSIAPMYPYDNTQYIKDFIEDNDLEYKYVYESPMPQYKANNGLIILSKSPFPNNHINENLPSGLFNVPGMMGISNDEYQIINCHLVPVLQSQVSYMYRFINTINELMGFDIMMCQLESIDIINQHIDKTKKVILLGDFNIQKKIKYNNVITNYDYISICTDLIDTSGTDISVTNYKNCLKPQHVDYIFISSKDPYTFTIDDTNQLISDHHPIMLITE